MEGFIDQERQGFKLQVSELIPQEILFASSKLKGSNASQITLRDGASSHILWLCIGGI